MTGERNASIPALLWRLARPRQWIKNLSCFAGVVFSGKMFSPEPLAAAAGAAVAFSLVSSGGYVVNDIVDRRRDRLNPRTRGRPLASGDLPVSAAVPAAVFLYAAGLFGGGFLGGRFLSVLLAYAALGVLYSAALKHRVLLDVFAIALGFVLRVLGGIFAVGAEPTAWIALCMLFISLFLGFGKRRGELSGTTGRGEEGRPALRFYSVPFLDSLLQMTGSIAILAYALFTATSGRNHSLVMTVPFVAYGVLRYLHQVVERGRGESPEDLLLGDPPLLVTIVLWLLASVVILYWDLQIFE